MGEERSEEREGGREEGRVWQVSESDKDLHQFRREHRRLERHVVSLRLKERRHLLESEFGVAGGAGKTGDAPGFVEGRDH